MPTKLILVAGAHGVGKTTVCGQVAQTLSAHHASAGALIQQRGRPILEDKTVPDVAANQRVLIAAVHDLRRELGDIRLVLDGHFCVFVPGGGVEKIDLETFRQLAPDLLVVVLDDPTSIRDRRRARDTIQPPGLAEIAAAQAEELAHARVVAVDLQVPLVTFSVGGSLATLATTIAAHLEAPTG